MVNKLQNKNERIQDGLIEIDTIKDKLSELIDTNKINHFQTNLETLDIAKHIEIMNYLNNFSKECLMILKHETTRRAVVNEIKMFYERGATRKERKRMRINEKLKTPKHFDSGAIFEKSDERNKKAAKSVDIESMNVE